MNALFATLTLEQAMKLVSDYSPADARPLRAELLRIVFDRAMAAERDAVNWQSMSSADLLAVISYLAEKERAEIADRPIVLDASPPHPTSHSRHV